MQRIKLKLDLTQNTYENFTECTPVFYEMIGDLASTMHIILHQILKETV